MKSPNKKLTTAYELKQISIPTAAGKKLAFFWTPYTLTKNVFNEISGLDGK
jgi:hypothetical protein